MFRKILLILSCVSVISLSACSHNANYNTNNVDENYKKLQEILDTKQLNNQQRYSIISQMSNNYLEKKDYHGLIIFLSDWVEANPDDMYNSYWLLMTAYAYLSTEAEPVAEYYFDRILQQYSDLLVKGKSVHFLCLQNLIQISTTPENRIKYFNELINRFPKNINTTELYYRLAMEYESDYQWDKALKTYSLFLEQPDASTIQIPGLPDAYKNARHLVDFSNSSKSWTYENLNTLVNRIRNAIWNYDAEALESYKAKVNFFSMSWKQDEFDPNSQKIINMADYMHGNKIHVSTTLDDSSNQNEAYLKTWGWSTYQPVWYFYFRRVDFPLNPDIHGNWEWAGIYLGNKL